MKQYEIWDMHCHIYPDKIAEKAVHTIGEFYGIAMDHPGSSTELIKSGDKIGVSRYLVSSAATTPMQVESINNFIASQCAEHPQFIGFGTLHPDMEDCEQEVARLKQLGLKGVKLHPDFQKFCIDSPRAIVLYRACAEARVPILFHTGDKRYSFSSPVSLASAMDKVPDMVCIAAHFGGYSEWEKVVPVLNRDNVYFDTSSTLFELPAEKAGEMIEVLGEDKFFFATDFPMWDHVGELERFNKIKLTEKQREKIFSLNAKSFFARFEG